MDMFSARLQNLQDYVQLRVRDKSIADFFCQEDVVVIYGFGDLGKILYEELKGRINFIGFIDTWNHGKSYKSTYVYGLESTELREKISRYRAIYIIVTPTWDFDSIANRCRYWLENSHVISVEDLFVFGWLEVIRDKNIFNNAYISLVKDILKENRIEKSIFLAGTTYETMLYMLFNSKWEQSVFLCEQTYMRGIVERVMGLNIPVVYYVPGNSMEHDRVIMRGIELLARHALWHNSEVYGADQLTISKPFRHANLTVIEDGNNNYHFGKSSNARDENGYIMYGFDPVIKKVILTGRHPIPWELKNKESVINVFSLWENKTQREKDTIMRCLGFDRTQIQQYIDEGYDTIFCTQKFSRNGYVTEKQQIEMCRKVLRHYDKRKMIIKPHPADTVDYQKWFPDYPVLSGEFPIDFVRLEGMAIKKIVGFFSTSLYGLFDEEQVDMYPEIAAKYGIDTMESGYAT